MLKRLFLANFVLMLVFVIHPEVSFAYRPLGTEDAGVAGKGVAQMEISWDYLKWNGEKEHVFLLVPIYGLTERLELSAEMPYLIHKFEEEPSEEGVGDINLVVKYLLINEGVKNPAFTLKGVVKLDNGDFEKGLGSGDKDYSIFVVVSKNIKDLTLHGQLGYTWIGKEKDENLRNIYLYGLALDYGLTEAFHIVGEINGYRHPDRREAEDPRNILLGITYKLSEKLILDLAIRRGLTVSTPDWSTTAGVSITF
jgi:hypothetical protein